ncbi:MAG: hypothetical protein M0Z42_04395 [Actinomycetota bacterium]|jgi:hypothetical protein|nr:hypothetical protein [Actinomycetota bacterium]
MTARSAVELSSDYEAMRASATGSLPPEAPRGLALFLAQGLAGWVRAWSPLPPAAPEAPSRERRSATTIANDVVRLLAEMALGAGLTAP